MTHLIWLHLLTWSRLLALVGFKAATEVYAIVEGPSFCINAYVEYVCGIKFCWIVPCGFEFCRVSVEIVVRHTHYVPDTSHTTTGAHVSPLTRLPRAVHGH